MSGALTTALASQALLVATGVVVARALGPDDRGLLALIFVLSAVVVQVGSFGVPTAVTYWLAAGGVGHRSLLRQLRFVRRPQLAAVLATHAVLVMLVLLAKSSTWVVWLGLLSLIATAGSLSQMYSLAALQGLRRFTAFNILRVLHAALYLGGVVALWSVDRATLTSVTFVVIGAGAVSTAVAWLVVLRPDATRESGTRDTREIEPRALVSFGLRSLAGSSPPLEAFRVDQLLVGLILPPIALGYYVVALAFTNLSRFIGQSIGMVTYPRVAAEQHRPHQLRLIRRDALIGTLVCGSATLVLVATVPVLLPFFFGDAFAVAVHPAQVLLVAALLASVRRILVDATRGAGWPLWGTAAEALTLIAVPGVIVLSFFTDSLVWVAAVIAGANMVGLAVLVPALFGRAYRDTVRRAESAGNGSEVLTIGPPINGG
jgi:O-antigen/teichoic acid export membrane protein